MNTRVPSNLLPLPSPSPAPCLTAGRAGLHGARRATRLAWGVLLLGLWAQAPARAKWTTQTFDLQPGWNAIYTHVAHATNTTLRQLVERDPNNPIAEVWLWQPALAGQQFVNSPAEPAATDSQWRSWTRSQSDTTNTLTHLPANAAFLVRAQTAASYTWSVVGKPVPPRHQWTTSGLNFVGFPTPPESAPSFRDFLAAQPALRQTAEIFRYTGDETPEQLFAYASTPVRRGEAYWVRSGEFFNRYFGPFQVILQSQDGIHFGDSGGQYRLRLRNLTPNAIQVITSYGSGTAAEPAGLAPQDRITSRPPLLLRGARSTTDLTYGFLALEGTVTTTNTLAAYGQEGFEAEVVLGIDRSQLTGEPGSLHAGILTLRDVQGLSRIELPVTALKESLGGLWVGSALVSQVRHYLQSPVRGPDGQNASDASPVVLTDDLGDPTALVNVLNGGNRMLTDWLAGQLSAATRQELAEAGALTLGVGSEASAKYSMKDIVDLPALVERLNSTAAGDAFRDWLRGRLPASTLQMLGLYGLPELDPRNLRAALVDTWNGLIVGPALYDPAGFAGVVLSPDTQSLLSLDPAPTNSLLARLNRRLLDDALEPAVNSKPTGLRNALAADLNRILYGPLVYRPERFEGVTLSADAKRLLADQPQGEALAYLNRKLLEEAFPAALLPNQRQYRFRTQDLRSLDDIAAKLRARGAGDVYDHLWNDLLAAETRAAVDAHGTGAGDPADLARRLVDDLNTRALSGPSLYTDPRFRAMDSTNRIALSAETQALRELNPVGAELMNLNRMLLEDAFPGAMAASYGRILVTRPREDFGSVARPFPLRLIVHNAGTNGVSLLQRAYVGMDEAGTQIVTTSEAKLALAKRASARRLSAPQLPWSAGNSPWSFAGELQRGRILRVTVPLGHDDQAANPFLHTYHPDHDNRNAFFDEELPMGEESYGIRRDITLSVAEPPTDFDARTVGNQSLSGLYGEVIRVQARQHGGKRPDEVRTFEVRGGFALRRILPNSTLVTP